MLLHGNTVATKGVKYISTRGVKDKFQQSIRREVSVKITIPWGL
jgi:hypothetical protein